jgi:hypothetical protein
MITEKIIKTEYGICFKKRSILDIIILYLLVSEKHFPGPTAKINFQQNFGNGYLGHFKEFTTGLQKRVRGDKPPKKSPLACR